MTRPKKIRGVTKMAISKNEIQSASVARGTDKQTHETFYVVKSDSSDTTWYTVRWNHERLMWCCNCPARCNGCKHQKAVNEVLKVRRATVALAMGGEVPAIVAKYQHDEDTRQEEKSSRPSQKGSLNGNRPFSLLK